MTRTPTLLALALVLLASLLAPLGASAQTTYYVDAAGAGVACTAVSPCPLIATALGLAVGGDTISVAAGTYTEGGLAISDDITIVGANPFTTIIDANGLGTRIFDISGGNVVLDRLALVNADIGLLSGGAIELTGGNVTILRSRLLDNDAAPGGFGGAIAAQPGSGVVTLVASVVSGNNAGGSGGAIWCEACGGVVLLLTNLSDNSAGTSGGGVWIDASPGLATQLSYVARNSAPQGGAINASATTVFLLGSELTANNATNGDGGAVFVAGNIDIQRSTLAGNTASLDSGGAVYFYSNANNIFASANSTFSGNSALCGGGLFFDANFGVGGDARVANATFADNASAFAGCADHVIHGTNTFRLSNSIVSGTTGNPACSAAMTGGTSNLLVDATCDTGGAAFNLGAVTGLNALAWNGGLTRTHMITAASNAIDAGDNSACVNPWASWGGAPVFLTMDQRGDPRARTAADRCDIGAVEP